MFEREQNYITQLGFKDNIKQVSKQNINIRCPICGDSATNKYKARGFIFGNTNVNYHCHNECGSMSFYSFIKVFDEQLAKSYFLELKKDGLINSVNNNNTKLDKSLFKEEDKRIETTEVKEDIKSDNGLLKVPFSKMIYSYLKSGDYQDLVYDYTELSFEAISYLQARGFKEEDYIDFKFVKETNDIIIPFFSDKENNQVYAIQSRNILEKRFHNQMFRNQPKIYNLEYILSLPKGSEVYCFEAIFNLLSSGIKNGIAIIGKSISNEVLQLLKDYKLIMCLDPDKAGDESLIQLAKKGYSGLLHDKDMYLNNLDTNDLLKLGMSKEGIKDYIKQNIVKSNRLYMELKLRGIKEK